ncbi:MAG: anthranilate phosphoribosyltransferase [Kofleriaceae bacterium]
MTAIVRAIAKALEKKDLERDEMAAVVGQIMDGETTPAQIGGFLIALRAKGEAVDELVGAATAMRARALHIAGGEHAIDTCGTGGDGTGTVNLSTIAAILIAAAGGTVAKHGNRALSSKCGSADVLEQLGVVIDAAPEIVARSIAVAKIGFMYAPRFHAATRHVGAPRKELGTRTIFNLLGPLTNPARVQHQVVGVYAQAWCAPVATALGALGLRRAAVVHGAGGLDELSVHGETYVALWDDGELRTLVLTPRSFGVDELDPDGLAGGDAAHNAAIVKKVLAGHQTDHGERLEAVLRAAAMTAALGLELLEPGFDLHHLKAQYERAVATTKNGAARLVLHQWREASQAPLDADLSELAALRPSEFAGVE